jgi:hypothetical protein
MNFLYFPSNQEIPQCLKAPIKSFEKHKSKIKSSDNDGTNEKRLSSDDVLRIVTSDLIKDGFVVETSKRRADKIRMPVHVGSEKQARLFFEVDAWNEETKVVIEVEAGRALDNHQFLKDVFEAAMMTHVDYLVIAVRECYRGRNDYLKIYEWLDPFYSTNRIKLDLKGILLVGY